ncbi:MAG: hypothetical protein A3F80_02210 [Candidatus Melainabacteria bacterium RIFCSPLOWO2_12_FULL_35_11]|nr:MAG: hypothetical protein A3F80_02210 [Candidatus Melainabacteria bacterium RIFCSPLOWO2_12_FULL_35_11]
MYRKKGGIFPTLLRYAPLTLTTLAALVPKELEAEIEIVDEGVCVLDENIEADLIGISAITGTAVRAYALANHFRKRGATVVLGGVHPTLMPQEAMHHADAVITGLAYETWPQLLRDFKNGELKKLYTQPENINLSNLPIPRRDLLKRFSYISYGAVQATFGCPYKCDFCAVTATSKNYLHRPITDVINEIEALGSHLIIFVDPSPIEDKKYIKELWRAMIPLKKIWSGLATVKIADDEELMDLAVKSGCKGLLIGFETVSNEGTQIINKSFNNVSNYKEIVKKLHDRGITINGTFMFGMDHDDKDSFKRTVDFVNEVKIDLPRYSIYTPFPGTPLFKRLEKEGRILTKNWTLYDAQHVVYKPLKMTSEELREGQLWAWKQTYSIKSIIHRILGSGVPPYVPLITNIGYRYYAKKLKDFPISKMEEIQFKWNPNHDSDEYILKEEIA